MSRHSNHSVHKFRDRDIVLLRIYWIDCTFVLLFLLLVAGCSNQPETGPVEVKWDRDVCERCRMVLSDRRYAAQVRGGPGHKAYKFDDFGDAILWLEDQAWKEDPKSKIWVADYRSRKWLDARQALFVKGMVTPMDFGLGATEKPMPGAMVFDEAVVFVRQRNRKKGLGAQ